MLSELFSKRELEVLALLVQGRSNRQIAEELVVAESTIKTHVHHILAKLKVRSRAQVLSRLRALEPAASNDGSGLTTMLQG